MSSSFMFLVYATIFLATTATAGHIHRAIAIPTSIAAAVPASKSYSRAVRVDNILYLTPLRGVNMLNNVLVAGGISAEVAKSISNVKAILNVAGCDLGDIIKLGVRLQNLADLPVVQLAVYNAFNVANKDPVFAGSVEAHSTLIDNAKVELYVEAGNCDFN